MGPDAVEKVSDHKPDLLLLDIQMPGMTGFDVLRLLEDPLPAVIFTTAYDHYAVDAFEVSAVDYLLKPISHDRFSEAVDKVIANQQSDVRQVLEKVREPNYIGRLPVRFMKRVKTA